MLSLYANVRSKHWFRYSEMVSAGDERKAGL